MNFKMNKTFPVAESTFNWDAIYHHVLGGMNKIEFCREINNTTRVQVEHELKKLLTPLKSIVDEYNDENQLKILKINS